MKKLPFKVITTFFILTWGFISSYAQTEKFVVCQENQGWLTNETKAIKLGECGEKDWVVKLISGDLPDNKEQKVSHLKNEVLKVLQGLSKNKINISELSDSNLVQIIAKNSNPEKIYLKEGELSPEIYEIVVGKSLSTATTLEIIITRGFSIGDKYNERGRYTIKVEGSNPTITNILDEFKKVERKLLTGTDNERDLDYQPYYYLKTKDLKQRLDPTKTAAEYNLKSGDTLRVFTDVR